MFCVLFWYQALLTGNRVILFIDGKFLSIFDPAAGGGSAKINVLQLFLDGCKDVFYFGIV